MPIRFERDEVRRRLLAKAEDSVTTEDILAFISAQDAAGAWSWRVLFDSSTVDLSTITRESVGRIAAHIEQVAQGRHRGPMAIVADSARVERIKEIYVVLCAQVVGLTIGVFDDQETAEQWLARMPTET